jgi:alkylation response protein AidB-like acyl-CoA dehydrogenase
MSDEGAGPSAGDVAAMKATCTDVGVAAAETALELLGPYADLAVCRVEQYLRDARVTQIYDGTNEVQHLLIGRELRRGLEEGR